MKGCANDAKKKKYSWGTINPQNVPNVLKGTLQKVPQSYFLDPDVHSISKQKFNI